MPVSVKPVSDSVKEDDDLRNSFKVKHYVIQSEKWGFESARIALISDLHGNMLGEHQELLMKALLDAKVDLCLVAGDMICRRSRESFQNSYKLLEQMTQYFPVYYAPGNHESWHHLTLHSRYYATYEEKLRDLGVVFLYNESVGMKVKDTRIRITGLELPLLYFKKPFARWLKPEDLKELIGVHEEECFDILLAHHPRFGNTYFEWGADLILSGHYHGGVFRFSENGGLISPQYHLLPRYCCGFFARGQQSMIVSPGLGDHSMPLRIHNPWELVILHCSQK